MQASRYRPAGHHFAAPTDPQAAAARRGLTRVAIVLALPLAGTLFALPFATPAPWFVGLAVFALVAVIARARIGVAHPHARFGAANTITLARAAGTALLAAFLLEPQLLQGGAGWIAFAGAAVLLAFDGIDGWLARRQGLASEFGARFDLEVDAALILVLAALALGLGKAGPWVLGLGLMRYAFLLAAWILPPLRAELPPSLRRKAVCVLQIAALALLLLPGILPPLSAAIAAVAFAVLVWSFALDTRWLLSRDRQPGSPQ